MQITEDIIKAIQNCIDTVGSISEFSQQSNINIETISKYLSRKTNSIKKESWDKLYPLIHPYLSKNGSSAAKKPDTSKYPDLCSDQKILLDAFAALPKELQEKQLLQIVELARKHVQDTKYEA
jgi:hypothetical protein